MKDEADYLREEIADHEEAEEIMAKEIDSLRASLTRAEEERDQAVEAIGALVGADIGAYTANHKPREEWDEYDHDVLPLWQNAISVHARLSRENVEQDKDA